MLDEMRNNEKKASNTDVIEKLRDNFPSCFTNEGAFDIAKFKDLIADSTEITNEGYGLNFLGKSYARYLASLEPDTLLVPQDINDSGNVYIVGDNFDSAKHILGSYRGRIKCIYMDPPYNTGSDGFTYADRFAFTKDVLVEKLNMSEDEAERLIDLTTRGSSSHSAWLTFMLPRLLMARDLLSKDGVIILSIDENEYANLKLLCDDVFDERNYAGEIIWKNSSKNDQAYISIQHEYFLFYVKNKDFNPGEWRERKEGLEEIYKAFEKFRRECGDDRDAIHKKALEWYKQFPESNPISDSSHYSWYDDINGVYFPDNIAGPNFGQYVYDVKHPINGKIVKAPAPGWRYPEEALLQKIEEGTIHFGDDETTVPKKKTYLKNTEYQSLTSIKYKDGRVASNMIEDLLGGKYFSNPKDVELMQRIFTAIGVTSGDYILDFFSGSATTAHSVMKMNAENNIDVKYIQLQIEEHLKESDAAYKDGFRTIDEIGRKRISAAAKKIKTDTGADIDYLYNLFRIETIKGDTIDKLEEFDPDAMTIGDDFSNEIDNKALLYTWLLKDGYGFDADVKTVMLNGYEAYYCGKHLYLINAGFNKNQVDELIKKYTEDVSFNPENIILFGYSFGNWTITESLKRNIKILENTQKEIVINFDVRY